MAEVAGPPSLTDGQWKQIAPLLPRTGPSPRGGRPRADDRACLDGVLWVLWTGGRWRDLPPGRFPSAATCWRRLRDWEVAGAWGRVWESFLATPEAAARPEWARHSPRRRPGAGRGVANGSAGGLHANSGHGLASGAT
jgi:transposase